MKRISGMVIVFLGMFIAPVYAQRYTVFTQFASGLGWSSELFFANQGLSTVSGMTISFYDTNGAPMSVNSNLGTASTFTVNLAAGATQVVQVTPSATYQEGYVVVEYPSAGSPVRASEIYRWEQGGVVQAEVGVPQQEQGDHFSFPVEVNSSAGILTAVALVNPAAFNSNTVAETLVLNLIGTDGTIKATTTVPLESGQHVAEYLHENWFPGLDNFVGTLSVSSPLGAGVMVLRQDHNAFGAYATDGGPILGPFMVSGTAVSEQEPNNTQATAQAVSVPSIINGTIGTAGDEDFFKFTGKAGDIISVICDAEDTGSSLDSVLGVFDSNFNLIGYNDQNGLAPQLYPVYDSFIEMVLPSDGTYYIGVTDYYGNGGPGYNYTLYVKKQ